MQPIISAVICSYNREKYIRLSIDSLIAQTLDEEHYEILLVDNGSTDSTKEIVESSYLGRVVNFRYIYEPELGLSRARNRGLKEALGRYVAYLDDDAIADPDWLEHILRAFDERKNENPGSVGGRVDPIWEIPRPVWLADQMQNPLTILNLSDTPIRLTPQQWLAGANIAFPKSVLEEVGGFREDLGRIGNNLLSNDEYLLKKQLEAKSHFFYYYPDIRVQHHVPASRLNKKFFFRRYFWQGISNVVMRRHLGELVPSAKRKYIKNELKYFIKHYQDLFQLLFPSNRSERIHANCMTLLRIGQLYGIMKYL